MKQRIKDPEWEVVLDKLDQMIAFIQLMRKEGKAFYKTLNKAS